MLRVFGALLLPLCGWLTGDAFQQRTREQLCALEWSIRLLRRIRQEIAFRRADLTQLDAQLQREGLLETPAKPRALQALAPPKALSEAERACFAECMSGLGRTSAEQECERLDYYIARFRSFAAGTAAGPCPGRSAAPAGAGSRYGAGDLLFLKAGGRKGGN